MIAARLSRMRRLRRDERGATIIEFATILTPLLMLVLGSMEAGYMVLSKSIIEGALRDAARMSTTGKFTAEEIDKHVRDSLDLIGGAEAEIVKKSYAEFKQVGRPEPIKSDVAPLGGAPGKGDCYLDVNGNKQWDASPGRNGLGAAEDIGYYEVKVRYPMLFNFMGPAFGADDEDMLTLTANTSVKNEPFALRMTTEPKTECIA